MTDYKQIRESLQIQALTEEEKQKRGILARLCGPCASVISATRNGRFYNDELWEKVFNENEIVKEMFANGGICMELDHPVDREETCSQNIAAMLPEPPKRDKDGHLICYVDLIDTPCGKIAYQLAKYGFKLGISSRGTGDLYTDENGNEAVDPDTYDFTTFDLVLLPAVKEARLEMLESYNKNKKNLKKALTEAYTGASKEDRVIMEKVINNLEYDMKLKEAFSAAEIDELMKLSKKCGFVTVKDLYDYMEKNNISEKDLLANLKDKCNEALNEGRGIDMNAAAQNYADKCIKRDGISEDDPSYGKLYRKYMKEYEDKKLYLDPKYNKENAEFYDEALNEELVEGGLLDGEDLVELDEYESNESLEEAKKDDEEVEEEEEEIEAEEEEKEDDSEEEEKEEAEEEESEEEDDEAEIETVDDFIKQLKEYKKLPLEFAPIEIDGVEYPVNLIVDDSDEEKLVLKLDYSPEEEDNIEQAEAEAEMPEEEVVPEEAVEETEEAIDNGEDEVLESLKEMVRQKGLLEKQLKTLQNEKAVSDTEVKSLKEELSRYKESFARVSGIAAEAKKFEQQVGTLTEQNKLQESKINELRKVNSEKLNESVKAKNQIDAEVKKLTESLNSKQTELNAANKRLTEQATMYKQKLAENAQKVSENAKIAEAYRNKLVGVVNRYVESKAKMLGVTVNEIKNKLNENYSIDDIERVCDDILSSKVSRNTINVNRNSRIQVNENVVSKKSSSNGLEVDDMLLELAGLKDESWI